MLDLLLNMLPGWLVRAKEPKGEGERRAWKRIRRFGQLLYVSLWALGMGGVLFLIDLLWMRLVEGEKVDRFFVGFGAAWWILGGLVVGVVDWHLRERRFRMAESSGSAGASGAE